MSRIKKSYVAGSEPYRMLPFRLTLFLDNVGLWRIGMDNGNKELAVNWGTHDQKNYNSRQLAVTFYTLKFPLSTPYVAIQRCRGRLWENGGFLLKSDDSIVGNLSATTKSFARSRCASMISGPESSVVWLLIKSITLKARVTFSFKYFLWA